MRRNRNLDAWLERHIPCFAAFGEDERDRFVGDLTFRLYRPGEAVYQQDARGASAFAVRSGCLKISHIDGSGREQILSMAFEGAFVGVASVLDPSENPRHTTSARAVRKTVIGAVSAPVLHGLLEQNPGAALAVARYLAGRLQRVERKLVNVTRYNAKARVAGLLLAFADEYGTATDDGPLLDLGLTHAQVAGLIGMSRETVTRTLKAFRESGWIRMDRQGLTLLDPEGLRRCRNGEPHPNGRA